MSEAEISALLGGSELGTSVQENYIDVSRHVPHTRVPLVEDKMSKT